MGDPPLALDPADAVALLDRAEALQAEAVALIRDIDLVALLGRLGIPEQIGSSASGLMVWRDIDIGVRCRDLTAARAWRALQPLLADPRLRRLTYRDELDERSPTGVAADQRLYFVLYLEEPSSHEWKIDLSLWLSDAPRRQLDHVAALRRRLNAETRLAILWIKDVWHRLPSYPDTVGGVEVYDAVLDHGVRTPADFARYLRERGLPVS